MTIDAKRWDAIHKKIHKQQEWHSSYAEEKENLFPRNSLVVDLGAGTGADAVYFLRKGHSVVALDISEFALKVTQEKAKAAGFSKNLVTKQVDFGLFLLPVKDASVDVVYSRISLNYFGLKQTTIIFGDIYRILKPGGFAYVSLKSPDDTVEMGYLEKSSTVYEPNVFIEGSMLRSRFSIKQIEGMLRKAGIPNFEVKPYKEDLGGRREEHHPILYVNEIAFKKQ
jgi:ubiquinone/menaquinone biosynthesis C-methylase UbiE